MKKQPLIVRFARWIIRNHDGEDRLGINLAVPKARPSMDRGSDTISFTIHPASGGYVVESNYYNERTDRHNRQLHIITSQEDFSAELGKAVFMDMLKNR